MNNKFYVTTAIPYVNSKPHIGFALELIQSDVIARYHRIIGKDTYFLTGSDENSLKNVQAAEKEGISTQELCDKHSQSFMELKDVLDISNDDFIRTTDKKHFKGAQKLWLACRPDDIYKKKYKGFYCVGCECFYPEKDLVDGMCPEHKTKPDVIEEENYFFKLSEYQQKLKTLIEKDDIKIIPEHRKNEVLSFIGQGLEDFSISRSKERAKDWGVPIPGDKEQVMYVWFDALSNYITALDYADDGELFKKFWPADVHMIGKGILRFHAVYWPAMLMSAGLPLPKSIFVHGYITVEGQKISKSLGNVIDPVALVDEFGIDAVRYFLLREISPTHDGDFSRERFIKRYNADLANDLGNLASRVANMIEKFFDGELPEVEVENEYDLEKINTLIEEFKFNEALEYVWKLISTANSFVEEEKPWELAAIKNMDKLAKVLTKLKITCLDVSLALEPFLPSTSVAIKKHFSQKTITSIEPLFPRIQ
ncbi:methionine--tRNA ligase [Patescibacteria group bacterium]|nr:methionine--tRNA ligase [Patescibacteria group bacterium]MBU1673152.1 methionine--tRNA ligase [Patescibacteria group bacterium]MBU1963475.1 methionine--tRNA ligase [Patescibacteria group bacterium]